MSATTEGGTALPNTDVSILLGRLTRERSFPALVGRRVSLILS
jgi:hypothetical protein